MSKGWKAFLIFAAMIALPILADNLLNSRPDIRLFVSLEWSAVWLLLLIFLVGAFPVGWNAFWKFKEDIEGIQGNLKLAERELTKLLADNWDQGGRLGKVKERAEWAAMAHPTIVHNLKGEELAKLAEDLAKWSPLAQPSVVHLYHKEGYRTVAHDAFDLNKDDMKSRGAAMSKATMTAILLRDLYQGSTGRAQKKISHVKESGSDTFVAPGIWQLIGFDKFDPATKKFPDGSAVNWIMLCLAVEHGKFPKELRLVDKGQLFQGWMVIKKLTEPAPPPGEDWTDIPDTPASISMLRLWWKWLTWWE